MSDVRDSATDQPLPKPGKKLVQERLIGFIRGEHFSNDVSFEITSGIEQRRELGIKKYGTPVQTFNGRDALLDAWQESLDLLTYIYQLDLEEGGWEETLHRVIVVVEDLAYARIRRS
jgi:hypothetical protein